MDLPDSDGLDRLSVFLIGEDVTEGAETSLLCFEMVSPSSLWDRLELLELLFSSLREDLWPRCSLLADWALDMELIRRLLLARLICCLLLESRSRDSLEVCLESRSRSRYSLLLPSLSLREEFCRLLPSWSLRLELERRPWLRREEEDAGAGVGSALSCGLGA